MLVRACGGAGACACGVRRAPICGCGGALAMILPISSSSGRDSAESSSISLGAREAYCCIGCCGLARCATAELEPCDGWRGIRILCDRLPGDRGARDQHRLRVDLREGPVEDSHHLHIAAVGAVAAHHDADDVSAGIAAEQIVVTEMDPAAEAEARQRKVMKVLREVVGEMVRQNAEVGG